MGPLVDISATPEEISHREITSTRKPSYLCLKPCDPLYIEHVSHCPSALILSMTMSRNNAERQSVPPHPFLLSVVLVDWSVKDLWVHIWKGHSQLAHPTRPRPKELNN